MGLKSASHYYAPADDTSTRVLLQPVPYGTTGEFSLNLWIRNDLGETEGTLGAGQPFEYVFSHADRDVLRRVRFDGFQPSQVRFLVYCDFRLYFKNFGFYFKNWLGDSEQFSVVLEYVFSHYDRDVLRRVRFNGFQPS